MNLIQKLNAQIDKLTHNHELLQFENDSLKLQIEDMKNKNDELLRSSQDMLLKIDSTLTFAKGNNEEETDISHK